MNEINCIRQVSNFSKVKVSDRFDKETFDTSKFIEELPIKSPKIVSLLNNIQELDKKDYRKEKKLYKHFIFTGVKNTSKLLTSAFISAGYTFILKRQGSKIVIDDKKLHSNDEAKFVALSSTSLWNNKITPELTKEILKVFNKRPDNIYGNNVRFIILDSGFKEGVDLFDVKYCHIFEEQLYNSDNIQAIGRGLRYCGQKGLNYPWDLQIFTYKLYKKVPKFLGTKKEVIIENIISKDKNITFKNNFEKSLLDTIKEASIDKTLNKEINEPKEKSGTSVINKILVPTVLFGTLGLILKKRRDNKRQMIEEFSKLVKAFGKKKK